MLAMGLAMGVIPRMLMPELEADRGGKPAPLPCRCGCPCSALVGVVAQ